MISFLIKGLLRDRSRSLFPVLMVATGAFLTVFLYCWITGITGDMVRGIAQFNTGHVKVITKAFREQKDQMPNDLALLGVKNILDTLEHFDPNMIWLPRIRFGGLLDIPDSKGETRSQGPVMGLGVELFDNKSPEINILNLKKALVQGNLPQKKNEILISEEFAKRLRVKIGETATLLSSTMYGEMAMQNFKISGTLRFGVAAMDRSTIIADIHDIQNALDMEDGASEIVGFTKDMVYFDEPMIFLAKKFNSAFSKPDDKFSPVMESLSEQNEMNDLLKMANYIGSLMAGVFVFAMSIVLWNSGLMNGIRRYGEIGVRLAMGEPKGVLYRRMIIESFFIGLAGSGIGTILGLAVSYYLQFVGLDFGYIMQKATVMISSEIKARVTPTSYIIGFVPGLIAPVIGSLFAGIGIYRRQTSQLFKELEV
ncbi:MAG: FtsX-like permease family protein [Elusimicrobia bacterium]|nr:FtsX-like permease family protein [Elusimicrobiota bacterium]